jgi:hypothetical protein
MTDAELLTALEQCTLPLESLSHRSHVKVAFLYLRDHPFHDAVNRMRQGIKALNIANNVPDGPTQGYNETTTVAFLHLIAATMAAYNPQMPAPNADAFCDTHPQLMSRHALRLFYSPARRLHPDAKTRFIEPDLAPLPMIVSQ